MIWRSVLIVSRLGVRGHFFHSSSRLLADALRDEAIQARYVRFIDFDTGSISSEALRTSQLLRRIDRNRFWLVQVKASKFDTELSTSSGNNNNSNTNTSKGGINLQIESQQSQKGSRRPPKPMNRDEQRYREEVESKLSLEDLAIVKLIDKKEEYDKQKKLKLEKRQSKLTSSTASSSSLAAEKEVEMTWSSTSNDIQHKLKNSLNHLKKRGPGARVTVKVKAKPGKGRTGGMDDEQKTELVQKIDDYLCNWDISEEEAVEVASEVLYHARRVGEVDWQKGRSVAMMRFEVVKGRSKAPKATTTEKATKPTTTK